MKTLELDPHFEDMPIEQVNQYLRDHGYDPEQVGVRGKILTDALIENMELRAENKRLREALEVYANEYNWNMTEDDGDLWNGKDSGWVVAQDALKGGA